MPRLHLRASVHACTSGPASGSARLADGRGGWPRLDDRRVVVTYRVHNTVPSITRCVWPGRCPGARLHAAAHDEIKRSESSAAA